MCDPSIKLLHESFPTCIIIDAIIIPAVWERVCLDKDLVWNFFFVLLLERLRVAEYTHA